MNIETSSLAIVISFLAGIIASLLFYFRDKSLKETAKWIKLTLSVCRFFIVFIISFLLFSPLTIKTKEQVKQPVLPVLVDNSKSLNIIDSSFNKDILPFLNRLKDESKNVEVKVIPFSNGLNVGEELTFNKQGTNLSNSITELIENFSNENIGGVVLVSDGISTAGNNILPGAEFPIYTLGVGDSSVRPDAKVKEFYFNDFVFVGNEFVTESQFKFENLKGVSQTISVSFNNKIVCQRSYTPKSNDDFFKVKCLIEASKGGSYPLKVEVVNSANEVNSRNNTLTRFITVKEKKLKLLVVSDRPSPEIRAFKSAFWGQEHVEVSSAKFSSKPNLNLINAVVFVGNSSDENKRRWLGLLKERKLGFVWLTGTSGDFVNDYFEFIRLDNSNDQVRMRSNSNFSLFKPGDELKEFLEGEIPVAVPFGKWKFKGEYQDLTTQEINGVVTDYSQVVYSSNLGANYAVFIGEGYWRLGMKNRQGLDNLYRKTIDYVSTKSDNSRFRIFLNSEYSNLDEIILGAEFYNKVNELDNEGEVEFKLTKEDSVVASSVMQKTNDKYRLNLGSLNPGVYSLKMTFKKGTEVITKSKNFVVFEMKMESESLTMNSDYLINLSNQSSGSFNSWKNRNNLLKSLSSSKSFKSVSYFESITDFLIKHKWVFYLLISLISIEWLVRKWQGAI